MNKRLSWASVFVIVGCAAGSDTASDMAADAMTRVGDMLSDAGRALGDTGVVLAQDSDTVTAKCDAFTDWTVTPNDSKQPATTIRTYFADVSTDTSNVVGVDARLCDRESLGDDPLVRICPEGADPSECKGCPANSTCVGEYDHIAPCSVTSTALLDADKIRVTCGGASFSGPGPQRGFRWNQVEVHVRRR